jgi:hypothetical protein
MRARTRAELDALDEWVIDAWLLAPLDVDLASRVVRLSLEQSLRNVGIDLPAWMPGPRNERRTAWYVEREWPVVRCTLTVRNVEEVIEAVDEGAPLSSAFEFDEHTGVLDIDNGTVRLRLSALDLELEVEPRAVDWRRERGWKIGPFEFESGSSGE